jgi:transposase
VDEWLPERHLARFVVEVINGLDLKAMSKTSRGCGSASYHPTVLLSVLIYGCASGVFSSRKLERATYDSAAFRFIAGNDHPDHDTIATFHRRFLKEIEALCVEVLKLARQMGVLKMGTMALDGTKIHANASRHSALSYEHAGKIEAQLKAEVADLLAKAEAADQSDVPDGMSIPEELERRETRLAKLAEARAKIEARAKEHPARAQAEYEAKVAARADKAAATGKQPRGKPPQPPVEGRLPTDQINLTDEDPRIMPVAGGGFEPCYNAQAAVAADSLLVVATNVVQAANDKQQLAPMLNKVAALPDELGEVASMLADNGYFSAANVAACEAAGIEPVIAPRLRKGKDGAPAAPPTSGRALCRTAGGAGEPHSGRGDGTPVEDARGPQALCPAQADSRAGIRHHQVGDGLPAVPGGWDRGCPGRVEPCDHGVEHQAVVRPEPRRLGGDGGLTRSNQAGCRTIPAILAA